MSGSLRDSIVTFTKMGRRGITLQTRFLLALGLVVLVADPAYAYVDPGTGMLAIQGFIAGIVWLLAVVTHPVRALRSLIQRLRRKGDA